MEKKKKKIDIFNLDSEYDIRFVSDSELKRYIPSIEFEFRDISSIALDILNYVWLLYTTFDEQNDFNFSQGNILISAIYPRLVYLCRELMIEDDKRSEKLLLDNYDNF